MVVRPQPIRPNHLYHTNVDTSTFLPEQSKSTIRTKKSLQTTTSFSRMLTTPTPPSNKFPPQLPSSKSLASPTPTSQLSEHSTDGSRSIPTVDVPTLARLFSSNPSDSKPNSFNKTLTSASIISEASNEDTPDNDTDNHPNSTTRPNPPVIIQSSLPSSNQPPQSFDEYQVYDDDEADSFAGPASVPILPRVSNPNSSLMPASFLDDGALQTSVKKPTSRDVMADPPQRNLRYIRAAQTRHLSALEMSTPTSKNWDPPSSNLVAKGLYPAANNNSNPQLYHPTTGPTVRVSADAGPRNTAIGRSSGSLPLKGNPPVTLHRYPNNRAVDPTLGSRKQRRAASHVGTLGLPPKTSSDKLKYRQRVGTGVDDTDPQDKRRRRRSSYLTNAFGRRRNSSVSMEIPKENIEDKDLSFAGSKKMLNAHKKDVDSQNGNVTDVEPVHAFIPLVKFGKHWTSDSVILYTNSIRAEMNDLIFLSGCMQRKWEKDGLSGVKDKQQHNIEIDFETWFSRFAQYTELVLRGFEEYFFPFISDILSQRDVMISRTTANVEAAGRSYVEAWSVATKDLFSRMEEVKDLISQVENRVLRLQRRRLARDNKARNDMWVATRHAVIELIPTTVSLLDQLNVKITEMLVLKADSKKSLRKVYKQFANLITKEGPQMLGWSAIVTLTRWIDDRKIKSDHMAQLARASRQALFTRYRADNSHHAIVKNHRTGLMHEHRRL